MLFKRRNARGLLHFMRDGFYPKGGWARAVSYIGHRLKRLPDSPERIARGVYAGVFAVFSPFFGAHFIYALIVARILRGNYAAALIATFVSNPLTIAALAGMSLKSGYFLMGKPIADIDTSQFIDETSAFVVNVWSNVVAFSTNAPTDWTNSSHFYDDIFIPYLLGGTFMGAIIATFGYYVSIPLIKAYQNKRKQLLAQRKARKEERKAQGENP